MGCDIHLCVEKKIDGKWKSMDKWIKEDDTDNSKDYQYVKYDDEFYGGRSYNLFAILADVRNGYGFAGCDTGDGFKPISYPKGIPKDVTPEVSKYFENWGGDGHSHSWLTLKELKDYDWEGQKSKLRGVISMFKYIEWMKDKTKAPNGYSGGVLGPNVKHVSNKEMERRIAELDPKVKSDMLLVSEQDGMDLVALMGRGHGKKGDEYEYYTTVEWEETYKEAVDPYFFNTTIPKLEELAKDVGPENVRIVFFFDN